MAYFGRPPSDCRRSFGASFWRATKYLRLGTFQRVPQQQAARLTLPTKPQPESPASLPLSAASPFAVIYQGRQTTELLRHSQVSGAAGQASVGGVKFLEQRARTKLCSQAKEVEQPHLLTLQSKKSTAKTRLHLARDDGQQLG